MQQYDALALSQADIFPLQSVKLSLQKPWTDADSSDKDTAVDTTPDDDALTEFWPKLIQSVGFIVVYAITSNYIPLVLTVVQTVALILKLIFNF